MSEQEKGNVHLNNLIKRIVDDFDDRVGKENEPSNILLKGHLLIENLLQEILAIFDMTDENIARMSFHNKITCLTKIKSTDYIQKIILKLIPQLTSLNEVRNDLAHNFNFSINESDVDKMGNNIGSQYVIKKYESGHKNIKNNLLFVLNHIVRELGSTIYIKIEDIKREKEKQKTTVGSTNLGHQTPPPN